MDIKGLAEQICKKYNSRDPFEIAEGRNIIVLYEPLGSIRGYYSKSLRQAFIPHKSGFGTAAGSIYLWARTGALHLTSKHEYAIFAGFNFLFCEQA